MRLLYLICALQVFDDDDDDDDCYDVLANKSLGVCTAVILPAVTLRRVDTETRRCQTCSLRQRR